MTFSAQKISQQLLDDMESTGVWKSDCPVSPRRLRLLTLNYFGFDGQPHDDGQMVTLDALADNVITIFTKLFEMKFPIAKISLLNSYQGDDAASMEGNNTGCFNYRKIIGSDSALSLHAYGAAIDVNPHQNPFYEYNENECRITPLEGQHYMNRANMRPGMVEPIVQIFKDNGFPIWGGEWNAPIDWQHFQISREEAERLIA